MSFVDFSKMKLVSGIIVVALAISAQAQLTILQEPNMNHFALQTPSLKQSFTRYYGGNRNSGNSAALIQAGSTFAQQQQQQAQPQVYSQPTIQPQLAGPTPTQAAFQGLQGQFFGRNTLDPYYQQQQQAQFNQQYQNQEQVNQQQQAQQQQAQPQFYNTQQYYPGSNPLEASQQLNQPQFSFGPQDINAFYQQQFQAQQDQLRQVQPQQFPSQAVDNQDPFARQQQQPQAAAEPQAQQPNTRLSYSPSNEVSNVKFSSQGLNYNF